MPNFTTRQIRDLIREVAAAVRGESGADDAEPATTQRRNAPMVAPSAQRTGRRVRRARGPMVVYRINRPKRGRVAEPKDLGESTQKVWDYLRKHDPATQKEIEAGTRLGRKAAESAVWWLRNEGYIRSERFEG